MSGRNFSDESGFLPFEYFDRDTGTNLVSPFPVGVLGIHDENLGVGILIGAVTNEDWDDMPVIVVQDGEQAVEILGAECYWASPVDDEVVSILSRNDIAHNMMRATTYVQMLDADLD